MPDATVPDTSQAGFTLVELIVAMILIVFFSGMVLTFMFDFWGSAATLQTDSETLVERENAEDRVRSLLNVTSHLIDQNSIADSNVEVPDPGDSTGTHWLLIHAIPETITMPASGQYASVFYFQAPSVDANKNFILSGAQEYYDEYVFYLNGSTKQMLVRSLANPNATGNALTTTCPPASATSGCPADTVISSDVTSVDLNYYSKSGNVINYESSTDPSTGQYDGPDFPAVEVVQLTIHLQRNAAIDGATSTSNQTVIRVALRN